MIENVRNLFTFIAVHRVRKRGRGQCLQQTVGPNFTSEEGRSSAGKSRNWQLCVVLITERCARFRGAASREREWVTCWLAGILPCVSPSAASPEPEEERKSLHKTCSYDDDDGALHLHGLPAGWYWAPGRALAGWLTCTVGLHWVVVYVLSRNTFTLELLRRGNFPRDVVRRFTFGWQMLKCAYISISNRDSIEGFRKKTITPTFPRWSSWIFLPYAQCQLVNPNLLRYFWQKIVVFAFLES